ncbi:MAG: hypothetical protein ACI9X4_002994, partial [Glaciecola sp.]
QDQASRERAGSDMDLIVHPDYLIDLKDLPRSVSDWVSRASRVSWMG